ncbi:putative hydroxymethylpyrimidine transport system permease protein [Paenibacillus cellulosilyticus]|uniref:Putative hydroxymethylpyrimidine transport system permease protein n=1 Tax=Paenibacillus cellulosilyticus TaxID=375489 RepID=A0A2V2YQQ5_9BACL|nr:ABC transporter permease [Paenibacillus cellulosilyticus]PWV99492.1 putative hydroxymethylpyrimidine transport system permease protein [Paenibacillus cellulosilyticus]QKS44746.1 ABC transporter permease [Paenibacillus cellulosilyticus]
MKRKVSASIPVIVFVLLLAVIWEVGTSVFDVPHYIIPKLSDVFVSMWDNRALLGKHWLVTLWEALLGLGISIVIGTLAAIWIDRSTLARKTIYPLIVGSQTIPIIVLSPIMVMWFGYEIWSKITVVILFTFFSIAVNTADGFRSADPDIGALMKTMGASKRDLLLKWKLPSALPGFFTGLKMAAAFSVGGATLGEWLGGENGLGVYTKRASNMLRADAVFSGVLLLSAMGILLFLAALWLEKAVLAYRRT